MVLAPPEGGPQSSFPRVRLYSAAHPGVLQVNMARKVEILGQEWLSQQFMKLARFTLKHERYDGSMAGPMTREIVLRPPAAGVVPYDPTTDQIILIEQFRIAAHLGGMPAWQREIIAGISDREETLEDLVRREAMEEANCEITDLFEMIRFLPTPGMSSEIFVAFLGRMAPGAVTGVHGLATEHEDIRSTLFHLDQIPEILANGHTGNGPLLIALQWMQINRDRIRTLWR
jgi:ADP-ribose pyrophosphatase